LPKAFYGFILLLLLVPPSLNAAEPVEVIVEGLEGKAQES
jgi:hypothetical protein